MSANEALTRPFQRSSLTYSLFQIYTSRPKSCISALVNARIHKSYGETLVKGRCDTELTEHISDCRIHVDIVASDIEIDWDELRRMIVLAHETIVSLMKLCTLYESKCTDMIMPSFMGIVSLIVLVHDLPTDMIIPGVVIEQDTVDVQFRILCLGSVHITLHGLIHNDGTMFP